MIVPDPFIYALTDLLLEVAGKVEDYPDPDEELLNFLRDYWRIDHCPLDKSLLVLVTKGLRLTRLSFPEAVIPTLKDETIWFTLESCLETKLQLNPSEDPQLIRYTIGNQKRSLQVPSPDDALKMRACYYLRKGYYIEEVTGDYIAVVSPYFQKYTVTGTNTCSCNEFKTRLNSRAPCRHIDIGNYYLATRDRLDWKAEKRPKIKKGV